MSVEVENKTQGEIQGLVTSLGNLVENLGHRASEIKA